MFIFHVVPSPDQSVEAPEAEESGDQLAGWEKAVGVSGSPCQPVCFQRPTSHHAPGQTAVQLTVWIQYVILHTDLTDSPPVLCQNMMKLGQFY